MAAREKQNQSFNLTEVNKKTSSKGVRVLPGEVPIALTYNGVSHVVMMATPKDLKDFAIGFTLSEKIVARPEGIEKIDIIKAEKGFVAKIKIPQKDLKNLIERDRNLVGQTGCGLCGVADLEEAVRVYPKISTKPKIRTGAVFKSLKNIGKHQPLNRETSAVHAAAFCRWNGDILLAREDIGRHNAFDKLIGGLAVKKVKMEKGFVLLTSRCSYELVQKALAMKIPMLAAISAPTDLAVNLARAHDLTLIALAREDSFQVYNDPFGVFPLRE